jgi:hypothetical protein
MLSTAADIVADPSAPDAFVQGIMEGKEWIWNNGVLAEKTLRELNSLTPTVDKKIREERLLKAFNNYLRNL